ncbi:hypothetical protein C5C03_00395 [Clavibacter michiganensis]|uniref:hypothetical protein n=1 Tax=Clavibacter michiganensis TaxID=28447 RepID=UPI000CE7DB72|nr:hypothetical protein [Clavibacter michiganensis]PPF91317.1 hypothetical protein C5C03_00395 [Clavibacter michiganensis]PPF99359.1 hypothetical protein C5C05_02195 [Clavibacter michiganensis]
MSDTSRCTSALANELMFRVEGHSPDAHAARASAAQAIIDEARQRLDAWRADRFGSPPPMAPETAHLVVTAKGDLEQALRSPHFYIQVQTDQDRWPRVEVEVADGVFDVDYLDPAEVQYTHEQAARHHADVSAVRQALIDLGAVSPDAPTPYVPAPDGLADCMQFGVAGTGPAAHAGRAQAAAQALKVHQLTDNPNDPDLVPFGVHEVIAHGGDLDATLSSAMFAEELHAHLIPPHIVHELRDALAVVGAATFAPAPVPAEHAHELATMLTFEQRRDVVMELRRMERKHINSIADEWEVEATGYDRDVLWTNHIAPGLADAAREAAAFVERTGGLPLDPTMRQTISSAAPSAGWDAPSTSAPSHLRQVAAAVRDPAPEPVWPAPPAGQVAASSAPPPTAEREVMQGARASSASFPESAVASLAASAARASEPLSNGHDRSTGPGPSSSTSLSY